MNSFDTAIIGAGPAGMIAAYASAKNGSNTLLIEKNEKCGKKLYITGKGRCNITNIGSKSNFLDNIYRNNKFMISCLTGFSNEDLIKLLNHYGLKTKVERGGRIFPFSDKSSDVIKTFKYMMDFYHVKLLQNSPVLNINISDGGYIIKLKDRNVFSKKIIIATGGLSYPSTGCTGDGYKFAEKLGHTIVTPREALVSLIDAGDTCNRLQGLSLKNVALTLFYENKVLYKNIGELLFSHKGLTGPLALSASCFVSVNCDYKKLNATIDLKPALTHEQLKKRLLRDLSINRNRIIKTYMKELLPYKMVKPFLDMAELSSELPLNNLNKSQRDTIIKLLKCFQIKICGLGSFDEAIITSGGINIKEINPKTMGSRIVKNLYFAGEVIDVSALTGGYNLQIAFSTGYAAGVAAALN